MSYGRVPSRCVSRVLVGVLGTAAIAVATGCGGGDSGPAAPQPTAQGITGAVTVQPGSPADPTNARAAVYSSLADFGNDAWVQQVAVQRNGNAWSFSLDLNAGNYYVDVWKDNNNNGLFDGGDIYGFYTTGQGGQPAPVMVRDGQMSSISLEVRLSAPVAKARR